MICFHKWIYKGWTIGYQWLAGVKGGIPIETEVEYQQCEKCGKTRVCS